MAIRLEQDELGQVSGYVMFTADWCNPCKQLKPHIIDYIDYIVDLSEENHTDVRGVPTIRYYDHGDPVDEIVGPTPAGFREWAGI